ncbi:MAG: 5-oxoprolinase subunit PxpB [Treponema sp.]|uniref:5-oxoprolinase subunit PxpB n=1 Tax=Treponema sp. TaxID=166 RepID=UPI002A91CF66|nr:5-oxoprolinase subunit PxpB [Treponema sp.]MDY6396538.1 5-oxoprolinase subunit PxpB [Treponema sp.]
MYIAKIVSASEDSIQVQFYNKICPKVNRMVSDFSRAFALMTKDMPEIREIVPTYCAVSVYFDEKNCKSALLKEIALEVLEKIDGEEEKSTGSERIITIPVCYETEEFAPDLRKVAAHAKLTSEEVIKIHSSTDYLIYMMGFLPGFPYLGGMEKCLETPRLETPRTKIPAGSVAIGGAQTGLYPVESPGGWNIIGRTPLKLFDLNRNPHFLYNSGDKIRFEPISRKEFEDFDVYAENDWLWKNGFEAEAVQHSHSVVAGRKKPHEKNIPHYECGGGIKILVAGLLTTVQDKGTNGFQKYGISQSGAMDEMSFDLANSLCENPENRACLETTLCGPSLLFVTDCDFAITGAVFPEASLDGKPIEMNRKIHAKAGSLLHCGFASKGLRSYIAFSGGVLVPEVFGSRSTNLKGRIGGFNGRKLEAGDELALGFAGCHGKSMKESITPARKINPFFEQKEEVLILRCMKSSQTDSFSEDNLRNFTRSTYLVAADSDRMGIRFTGPALDCGKTDIISDAIPFGAVQITSAGLPVVMAADRQTTGGYAKIACVKKESMCALAQAAPGAKVQFYIEET